MNRCGKEALLNIRMLNEGDEKSLRNERNRGEINTCTLKTVDSEKQPTGIHQNFIGFIDIGSRSLVSYMIDLPSRCETIYIKLKWMTRVGTILIPKDTIKRTMENKYKLITC